MRWTWTFAGWRWNNTVWILSVLPKCSWVEGLVPSWLRYWEVTVLWGH
jgi:hypothetical protein